MLPLFQTYPGHMDELIAEGTIKVLDQDDYDSELTEEEDDPAGDPCMSV